MDFFLPPGFIELRTNGEVGDAFPVRGSVAARIILCNDFDCQAGGETTQFSMSSGLEGGFLTHGVSPTAFSTNPGLDLTPLTNTTLTVTDDVPNPSSGTPQRTIVWEYDAFDGQVSLGQFASGEAFTVRYVLEADARGLGLIEGVSSAINDPFTFDSDPVGPVPHSP